MTYLPAPIIFIMKCVTICFCAFIHDNTRSCTNESRVFSCRLNVFNRSTLMLADPIAVAFVANQKDVRIGSRAIASRSQSLIGIITTNSSMVPWKRGHDDTSQI
eukprot:TRINITY_DN12212_c0_g2_i1.p2 TRINITY_DN12212_c0_g2~~TRINITY_DN12212_c0_g2_i1.p2  ORF type:complete len:104 (-),score=5.62 TRINITY_DN12212_c0_g2_i1:132-443(-)